MSTLSSVSIFNPAETFLNTTVFNSENSGSDSGFIRSFDRINRTGLSSIEDDFLGRTLSVYNIDGLHSGENSPSDSLIQGNDNNMLAMYAGTGRVFSLSI